MKNISKKFICLFMTTAIIFTLADLSVFPRPELTLTVSAAETDSGSCGASTDTGGSDSVKWAYENGALTITGTGAMETYDESERPWNDYIKSITSVYIDSNVTSISRNAFCNAENLSSVTFGKGSELETIGKEAFAYCKKITEITVPAGVSSVGRYALFDCESLSSVTFAEGSKLEMIDESAFEYCVELKEIKLPVGLKVIGKYAFKGCEKIEKFSVPDSVTEIGEKTFADCGALSSVEFGENSKLETIGNHAFSKCEALEGINIPEGVKEIGEYSFNLCTALSAVTFGKNSKVESIGKNAFSYCGGITELTIPKKVKIIGENAFCECEKLSSLTFEEGSELKTIGDNAFDGCLALSAVNFAQGMELEIIGESAFNNCMGLEGFTIPNSVKSIGKYAFATCCNIYTVRIPGNIENIGEFAFISATVREVIYGGTEAEWNDLKTKCGKNNDDIFKYPDMKFTNTSGKCGDTPSDNVEWQFDRKSGTLIITGEGAISGYENVKDVPWEFFIRDIKNVEISGNITKIGEGAFGLGGKANFCCLPGSAAEAYAKENGINIIYFIKDKLVGYTADGDALNIFKLNYREFPESPASAYGIPENAFKDMTAVKKAIIEDGVTGIGQNAFAGCTALETVIVPESIKIIDNTAFEGCNALTAYCKAEGNVVFTLFAKGINCGFYIENTALGYIFDDGTMTVLKIRDGENTVISGCADEFKYTGYDKSISKLVIKDGVTGIGDDSFSGMDMVSVDIADSVKIISGSAFRYCSELGSVKIPDGVEAIRLYTFGDCDSLKSVEIPASVKTVEDKAFYKCPPDMKIIACCNLDTAYLSDYKDNITLSHSYVYTAEGDTITAVCANDKEHTAYLKLSAENAAFDGGEHKTAVLDSEKWTDSELLRPSEITYTGDTSKCGEITAGVSVGEGETAVTASVKYTIGHKLTAAEGSEASCTETGTAAYWACECCQKYFADEEGTKELESITVPAKGHDLTLTAANAAQCEADGNTAYYTCSVCGKFFGDESGKIEIEKDSWVLKATGHSYGEAVYTWTENTDGTYSCKAEIKCANNDTHVISETVTADISKKAPTCTVDGSAEYTAKFENELFAVQTKSEIIEAAGKHSFKEGKCTVCGETDPDYREPAVTSVTEVSMPATADSGTAATTITAASTSIYTVTTVSTSGIDVTVPASTVLTTTIITVTTVPAVTDSQGTSAVPAQTTAIPEVTAPAVTTVLIPLTTTAFTTAALTATVPTASAGSTAVTTNTSVSAAVTVTVPVTSAVVTSEVSATSRETGTAAAVTAVTSAQSSSGTVTTSVTVTETSAVPNVVTTFQTTGTESVLTTVNIPETSGVSGSTGTAVSSVTSGSDVTAVQTTALISESTEVTSASVPNETTTSETVGFTVTLNYDVNNDSAQWYNTDSGGFTAKGITVIADGLDVTAAAEITFDKTPAEVFDGKAHDYSVSYTVSYMGKSRTGSMPVKIALRGDANMDNKISLYDAIYISKKLIHKNETPFEKFLCDNNRNGKTDLYDAINIAKLILPSINGDWSKLK